MATVNVNPNGPHQNKSIPVSGHDLMDQAEKISIHWWSIIESVLEQAEYGKGINQPLPQWAIDRLKDNGFLHASCDQHRVTLEMAHQALNLAEGNGHDYTYEIWTSRTGHRLDVRYESMASAEKALAKAKKKYPDAFIARVHVRSPSYGNDDPALLDTLIGRLWWGGTWYGSGDEENYYTVQDSTGRTVTAPASILIAHQDVMSRLSEEARNRIECDLAENEQRRPLRTVKEVGNA